MLLLNGYSGESYTLPTEEDDLVRTLLNKGYEVWLLRMRLHFSVCTANPFSLDDIARFDLPAGISCLQIYNSDTHALSNMKADASLAMLVSDVAPV